MAVNLNNARWVLDSSSWIAIRLQPDALEIWSVLEPLLTLGILISPAQVWDEIKDDEEIAERIQPEKKFVIQKRATNIQHRQLEGAIIHQYPGMSGVRLTGKVKADPYVVALAEFHGLPVVAEESIKKPSRKIPTACAARGIPCGGFRAMLQTEFPDGNW